MRRILFGMWVACLALGACGRDRGAQPSSRAEVGSGDERAASQARAPAVEVYEGRAASKEQVAPEAQDVVEERVEIPEPRVRRETAAAGGTGLSDPPPVSEAMEQGTSEADRRIRQEIRRALIEDDSLSFTAKNIQIITRDGNVVLRGQVMNNKERKRIEEIARERAGVGSVDNRLQLKSSTSTLDVERDLP
jgi:osmotically-inducible protein OsmY